MAVLGDLLFYRRDQVDLDDALRHEVRLLQSKVDALSDKFFSEKSDEEIAGHIAKEHAILPLVLDLDAAVPSVEETQVEVHDRFWRDSGPINVPGLRATKSIPFKGDPELWRLRTNPYDLNPPRGEVRGNKLIIGTSVAAQQVDEAARYIEETIARLSEYLQRQEVQIARHNDSLAKHAMQWIQLRRQRLGKASDLLKKLGG